MRCSCTGRCRKTGRCPIKYSRKPSKMTIITQEDIINIWRKVAKEIKRTL